MKKQEQKEIIVKYIDGITNLAKRYSKEGEELISVGNINKKSEGYTLKKVSTDLLELLI